MKKEELQKTLEELKGKGKIVVGVEQWHDNDKKELVNVWENEKTNISQLLGFLYRKAVLKGVNIRIDYNYNYSDVQAISITESYTNYDNSITKTKYTFYNIPTQLAFLDTFKISKVLNDEN